MYLLFFILGSILSSIIPIAKLELLITILCACIFLIYKKKYLLANFLVGILLTSSYVFYFNLNTLTSEHDNKYFYIKAKTTNVHNNYVELTDVQFFFNDNIHVNTIKAYTDTKSHLKNNCEILAYIKLRKPYANTNIVNNTSIRNTFSKNFTAFGSIKNFSDLQCSNSGLRERTYQTILNLTKVRQQEVASLVLGKMAHLSQDNLEILKNGGILHLFVISGGHMSLLSLFVFLIAGRSWKYCAFFQKVDFALFVSIISGAVVVFYAFIAGFDIPVLRATISIIIIFTIVNLGFLQNAIDIWLKALALLIIFNPQSLFSSGLYLSFFASLVLILTYKRKPKSALLAFVEAQIIIFIALIPIGYIFNFNIASGSIVANLLAITVITFVTLPFEFLSVLLIWTSFHSIASITLNIAGISIDLIMLLVKKITDYLSAYHVFFEYKLQIILLVICCSSFLLPRGFTGRYVGFVLAVLLVLLPKKFSERLIIFDVGQGAAVLFSTENYNVLYDTGASFADYSVAKNILDVNFKKLNIKTIHKLIVSHADNDHAGGVHFLMQNYEILEIISGDKINFDNKFKIQSNACTGEFFIDKAHIKLWHAENFVGNDASCVMLIEANNKKALLTGDLTYKGEIEFLSQNQDISDIDVLLSPHHGSNSSSSTELLNALNVKTAVISRGKYNTYKHPSPEILKRYEQFNIDVVDTAKNGAFIYDFNYNKIKTKQSIFFNGAAFL